MKLGFIGCGNMAKAMIKGIIASGAVAPGEIYGSNATPEHAAAVAEEFGINAGTNNITVAENAGTRPVSFSRTLWVEQEDFMEEPPKKYFRMFPGNEVRLMNAYFVTCNSFVKDENGVVTEIHCTYDPASKGGNSPDGRKVKGTIQWVSAAQAVPAEIRLYENIVDEEKGVYNEDGSLNLNPNSLTVLKNCYIEPAIAGAKAYESFQFVRNGFFCVDYKDSKEDALVFNRIVSLKSSFKLPKA